MRRLASVLVVVAASFAGACSSGGGRRGDGSADAIIDLSLPWPDGCPPAANDKNVGAPCTSGGKQCKSPLLCTCDPQLGARLAGVPCFCTLAAFAKNGSTDPCTDSVPANYCGSGATCCNILTSVAYCSPNICLINGGCLVFVGPDGGT
jgi:hypothetical protein